MSVKPWKILESSYVRKNVRLDRCETAYGQIIEPLILEYGTWVNVLAITEQKETLLIQQ